VESFSAKLRDELLDAEIFTTLLEAKIMAEDYRQDYNQNRPHSTLGYKTPREFKKNWHLNNQGLTTVLAH
jgi:putative transposase